MGLQKTRKNKKNLQILYTSDIHSRFENLAKITSIIHDERSETSLILDAGDNADFMRIETEGTQGRISSHILNAMGYHARVFGNNEGFAGPENCKVIAETSNFPVASPLLSKRMFPRGVSTYSVFNLLEMWL